MTFKDFILSNTNLLKDMMSENIKQASIYPLETPTHLRKRLQEKRRELKLLINSDMEELIEKEFRKHKRIKAEVSGKTSDEIEYFKFTLSTLDSWITNTDAGSFLKSELHKSIQKKLDFALYGFCGFPKEMTREIAVKRIERQINYLRDEIKDLQIKLPLVIEYKRLMKEYSLQLMEDLK